MSLRKMKKENRYYGFIEFEKYVWFVIASKWSHSKSKMHFRRRQWAKTAVEECNRGKR